eukprot:767734-Hanusia_phi.AAC.3
MLFDALDAINQNSEITVSELTDPEKSDRDVCGFCELGGPCEFCDSLLLSPSENRSSSWFMEYTERDIGDRASKLELAEIRL